MQGDIFMLDRLSIQIPTSQNPAAAPQHKAAKTAPQVAIYNEDDLSHLLYADAVEPASASQHHMASIHDHFHHHDHHQHHNHDGALTPLEAPASGSHTPVFSDHESAVLEDWESDDELEIPPSPSRRRGGTLCSSDDDFEWPVFLGRQSDELDASLLRRPSLFKLDSSEPPHKAEKTSKRKNVTEEHHVSSISGPLMALWPSAMEVLEWQERFYE